MGSIARETDMNGTRRLLEGMAPYRGALLDVLRLCDTARSFDEIDACLHAAGGTGVYATDSVVRMLMDAGAIEPADHGGRREWLTTEEGRAAVSEDDPAQRLLGSIDEDSRFSSELRVVLETCGEKGGATLPQLDEAFERAHLDKDDTGRRAYPQHALDRLRDCGCVEWTASKTWATTAFGHEMLGRIA